MTEDQVRLHNEFILCLFNKVRGLAAAASPARASKIHNAHRSLDRDKAAKEKRLRLKRKYRTDKSNFEVKLLEKIINVTIIYLQLQSADMYVEVLNQNSSPVGDEPIGANRSSAQELVLPDRTFVLARLMLAAWENNMDGAEENTAHIVIAATQIFLKNILTAIFTKKKGFAVRDESFIYNIGEPVPSSWKRNTAYMVQCLDSWSVLSIVLIIIIHIKNISQWFDGCYRPGRANSSRKTNRGRCRTGNCLFFGLF